VECNIFDLLTFNPHSKSEHQPRQATDMPTSRRSYNIAAEKLAILTENWRIAWLRLVWPNASVEEAGALRIASLRRGFTTGSWQGTAKVCGLNTYTSAYRHATLIESCVAMTLPSLKHLQDGWCGSKLDIA
jgi:hypothetical protein